MTPESTVKAAEDIKIMFELPVLGMSTVLTVVASAVSVLVTDVVPDVLSEPGSGAEAVAYTHLRAHET